MNDDVIKAALIRRLKLLDKANADPEFKALTLRVCALDVVTFVNDWCFTVDPRRYPSTLPFDLFPKQAEFLKWLEARCNEKDDAIAEKSRDVGFTWLCCAFMVHRWLFVPGFKGTFGSRKKTLVDRLGDPDSIFEKMRLLIKSLPAWMKPNEKQWQNNELKLVNLLNGSTITGEGGDQMGRGGRSSLYIVDEAAFIDRPQRVDAAISANSDVKIWVSTPNGIGNPFAQKRFSGNFPVFTFRWQDDPRKDQSWYEKQKRTLDPVILAQEVDLDYQASLEGVCIPGKWVLSAVELYDRLLQSSTEEELRQIKRGDRQAGLDIADGGKNQNVLIVRQGIVVESVDAWQGDNTTQTAYKARDLCQGYQVRVLQYDCIGVGAGVGGTLKSTDNLGFDAQALNGGDSPTEMIWEQFGDRESNDIFLNLRAEIWWLLRTRFERTWEHLNGIKQHNLRDLISIPNNPTLIAQLSLPLVKYTDSGLIKIESKKDMATRGVESPDYADALAYAFTPVRSSVWAMGAAKWSH